MTEVFGAGAPDIKKILSKLDITLSALRDALKGTDNKDFSTLESDIEDIRNALASVGADKLQTKPDNPPNLDVALSTRATESTLSSIKSQTDKLTFSEDKLKISQEDDILQRKDRVTSSNEFIPSGMEFAFNNYTVSSGTETRLDGKLILKSLTVEGRIIVNGSIEFD